MSPASPARAQRLRFPLCGEEENGAEPASPPRHGAGGRRTHRSAVWGNTRKDLSFLSSCRRRRTIAETQHRLGLCHAGQDTCHQWMAREIHGQSHRRRMPSGVPNRVNK